MRLEDNDLLKCRRFQSRAGWAVVVCLYLSFATQFAFHIEVSPLQQKVFVVSNAILLPGLILLPGWYFGPWPGLVLSMVIWVAVARRAVRTWFERNVRLKGA